MNNQMGFIGFKNAETFNKQVKNGDLIKVFTKDGAFIEAVKLQNAEQVNGQDVCVIDYNNKHLRIDVGSIYL